MDGTSLSLRSVALHERSHCGRPELAGVIESAADTIDRQAAEIASLRAALKPFSDMAGELFSRNWNAGDVVTALDNPNDPHRVTAGDYFAARLALGRIVGKK